jgi:hypothetical protein
MMTVPFTWKEPPIGESGISPITIPDKRALPSGTAEGRQVTEELKISSNLSVGATRDVRSLMRQHLRKTPENSAGLCPYPFPFQIWFDGDAVRSRSASRRKRGGS